MRAIHRTIARTLASIGIIVAFSGLCGITKASGQMLSTKVYAAGLSSPLFAGSPPSDTHRLFVLEQITGRIRIIEDGNLLPTPFLDIHSLISAGGERGLLGLAFHPDYADNGYFFINYTNTSGDTTVARYKVSANDPDVADPNSAEVVIVIAQPYSNHNGGNLNFGPDGYLYMGMGDGGSGNDPGGRAQNGQVLLGKMLRLDVDTLPYTIPPDNPFVNDPNVLDEIWAIGMRNPWRWEFDRQTGDLYIADVGQSQIEEVDFQPAGDPGGENYGWRCMEGTRCTGLSGCTCNAPELTLPIYTYDHSNGRCSITGGFVYRGGAIPLLSGTYFFGDYCSANIWSFRYVNGQVTEFTDRTTELNPPGIHITSITSFGQDGNGELYVVSQGGTIYQIITKMQLEVSDLVAGQSSQFQVTGATPNQRVYFAYSLTGTGSTNIPPLGVTAALANPVLIATRQADGSGSASISRTIPGNAGGRTVWMQAAENGNTSNVVRSIVQ